LRVRFLDMYVSFFLGYLYLQDGARAATYSGPATKQEGTKMSLVKDNGQ
jgi:hypothetical protein